MKKIIQVTVLLICIIMMLSVTSNAFIAETFVSSNSIKTGDEIIYTIKLNENVVAANFDIKYNSESFELIESQTIGLKVAKKDGKISCIYLDLNEQGTNEFSIKFMSIKKDKEAVFSVENVKFRVVGEEESYTLENTKGLAIQKIEVSNKIMTRLMWLGVIGIGVIIMELIILTIANKIKNKGKQKVTKKMMTIVLALFTVGILSSTVKATTVQVQNFDSVINFSKMGEEKIAQIMLSKDDLYGQITKERLLVNNNTIISIKDENGNEIQDTDLVKTGYKIETANGTSTVILFGDANKDGIICDTDDMMVIINDYLGKQKADDIAKLAANLYNSDDVLDTDDIMQMINMYLGKLQGELLHDPIQNNTEENNQSGETNTEKTLYSGAYVEYSIKYTNVATYYSPDIQYGGTSTKTGWRVAYVEDNNAAKIITEGVPERVYLDGNAGKYVNSTQNFSKYVDSNIAVSAIGGLTLSEVQTYNINWLDGEDTEGYGNGGILTVLRDARDNGYLKYYYRTDGSMGAGSGVEVGIRPVVTLRKDAKIISGDGIENNPFVLEI